MKRILPDSNVFISDFHRQSGPVRLLFEESRRQEAELVVPEIVVVEVVEKFKDELAEAHRQFGRWRKKLNHRMRVELAAAPPLEIEAQTDAFRVELLAAIEDAGGRVVGFPAAGPEASVRRDIRKGRPFIEGRGWRDALIWDVVLEELAEDNVAFITADKDFRDGMLLHPDLVAEATAVGGGELRLYTSPRAYVDAEVAPALAAVEQFRQLLLHNAVFLRALQEQISEELVGSRESEFEHLDFFGTRVDIVSIEVDEAWPQTIEVQAAQELEDGGFNVDLNAVVEVAFDVYLFKYDAWSLEGEAFDRITDLDHNESVARANFSMTLEASLSASFAPNQPAVGPVWLDAVAEA